VAYIKFENADTQRALEEVAKNDPGGALEVIRRWRLFGDKAIRGDLASLAKLLRENEEFLKSRRGRFAVLAETDEEKAELDDWQERLGGIWEMER
jgi:hypothetical protein